MQVGSLSQSVEFQEIRRDFVRRLCSERKELLGLMGMDAELGPAGKTRVQELVHGIAGAAGMFGWSDLSALAKALDLLIEQSGCESADFDRRMDALLAQMESICRAERVTGDDS